MKQVVLINPDPLLIRLDNLFLYSNINKNYHSYSSFLLIIIPLRNFCLSFLFHKFIKPAFLFEGLLCFASFELLQSSKFICARRRRIIQLCASLHEMLCAFEGGNVKHVPISLFMENMSCDALRRQVGEEK